MRGIATPFRFWIQPGRPYLATCQGRLLSILQAFWMQTLYRLQLQSLSCLRYISLSSCSCTVHFTMQDLDRSPPGLCIAHQAADNHKGIAAHVRGACGPLVVSPKHKLQMHEACEVLATLVMYCAIACLSDLVKCRYLMILQEKMSRQIWISW